MIKSIAIASIMALWGATTNATTIDIYFSFTEAFTFGNPTVTGAFRGLTDDATSTPSVEILSITRDDQYSTGTVGAVDAFPSGSITVSSGEITAVTSLFAAFDTDNDLFFEETILFETRNVSGQDVVLASFVSFSVIQPSPNPLSVVSFSRTPFPTPIPLPAGALLLLTALGGLATLRHNRSSSHL